MSRRHLPEAGDAPASALFVERLGRWRGNCLRLQTVSLVEPEANPLREERVVSAFAGRSALIFHHLSR
jgi:hypothetical protein